MKNLRVVSKGAGAVVYGIGDHKVFGAKFLREMGWPAGAKVHSFEFKPVTPRQGYLNPAVPAGCALRVGYYARPGQIKVAAGFKPVPGMGMVPSRNFPEFSKLTRTSLYREYVNPYKRYISRSFIKGCDAFIAGELKKCRNMLIKLDGRTVGIASTVRGKVKGKPGMLVAWIWIDAKLPKAARESARHLLAKWLRGHATPLLSTAEHGVSRKTQKFFTSLGFKAERYIVDELSN